jgi:hypothetical protein
MQKIKKEIPNFFSRGAMDFFNSEIDMDQIAKNGFFITSEQYEPEFPRLYSIVLFMKNSKGDCTANVVNKFQAFKTLEEAKTELDKIQKIIETIKLNDGSLEKNVILKCHYVSFDNGIYAFYANLDEESEEEKTVLMDTATGMYSTVFL